MQHNLLLSPAPLHTLLCPGMVGLCLSFVGEITSLPRLGLPSSVEGSHSCSLLTNTTRLGNRCRSRFKRGKDWPPRKLKPVETKKRGGLAVFPDRRQYPEVFCKCTQTDKQIVYSRNKRTYLKLSVFQCENKEDISEHKTGRTVLYATFLRMAF